MDPTPIPNTLTVRLNGRLYLPGLIMSSGGSLQPTEILKRKREDTESDDTAAQAIEKLRITARNSVVFLRRTKVPRDGTVPAAFKLSVDIWKIILEHCTPSVLRKARLLSKGFRLLIDSYQTLLINCRFLTYGLDILSLPEGLSERQFNILLEGKGCMCCGNSKTSKTYWTWCKRWCVECWRQKIVTEPTARRYLVGKVTRSVDVLRIFEALPWGMIDSWRNPHHLVKDEDRQNVKVGLQKVFEIDYFTKITNQYIGTIPIKPRRGNGMSHATWSTLRVEYHQRMNELPGKLNAFFNELVDKKNKIMEKAMAIEAAVRDKAKRDKEEKKKNQESRRVLFQVRAEEELPDVPIDFIISTQSFKSAIRISRDGGSQGSWEVLKRKLVLEWKLAHGAKGEET